ncbi:MAG: hypothetical protein ACI88A_004950, partial [Paraglaciecola sp.]
DIRTPLQQEAPLWREQDTRPEPIDTPKSKT